ncbi:ACT domain-containing protein [Neotabrizicola shimadae]|uniref:ACT domain-containing protein n=1 Tax=Neotabrizicola shimadae TaxID=2807096 RepID=A0A8G0ZYA9_9RHOB|nr:ACT domain-containing protein [Neotabrizicola shimadae]QYZ71302.1 ACT domain-containing protein [Neotabrizicola shimadae]
MTGERDLKRLIEGMRPLLDPLDWAYALAPAGTVVPEAWATIREAEGVTVIAPWSELQGRGWPLSGPWARITLTIHSSLDAVGLTAAVSDALAQAGIPANLIAGWHHDHIFLPRDHADAAMAALQTLAGPA